MKNKEKYQDDDHATVVGSDGSCKMIRTDYTDDSTERLKYNACRMCHTDMQHAERARAFAQTLGVGLLGMFGVGEQAELGFNAANAAEEKAGGIIDSGTMVSRLSSQLSAIRESSMKSLAEKAEEISEGEFEAIVNLHKNIDTQIQYVEETIQFDIDVLSIIQTSFSICLLSIIFYISNQM